VRRTLLPLYRLIATPKPGSASHRAGCGPGDGPSAIAQRRWRRSSTADVAVHEFLHHRSRWQNTCCAGAGDEVILPEFHVRVLRQRSGSRGRATCLRRYRSATLNLDPDAAYAPSCRRRAIIVVHYGPASAIDQLTDLAARHGVRLIEDAAPSIGWYGRRPGRSATAVQLTAPRTSREAAPPSAATGRRAG
jgi:hypothetical protein